MASIEIEILRYIAANDGGVTFFQIARQFGHTEEDLPEILYYLKVWKWVAEEAKTSGVMPSLRVTELGRNVL